MTQRFGPATEDGSTPTKRDAPRPLAELAWLFLKLGTIAFGGPAAHIGMMENEVVRRRRWMSPEEFLDLLGAANLIPGPNSTEMAIFIGQRRAGFPGLIVAGACFILPAMLIVIGCGWVYLRFGKLPQIEGLLYGIKAVIISVVIQALWGLARKALKSVALGVVAAIAVALSVLGANELAVLFAAGAVVAMIQAAERLRTRLPALAIPITGPFFAEALPATLSGSTETPFGLGALFLFFLKVGSVLYGSGYVLLAFLRSGLVERFGWLNENQLLDAIAVGQITPGPVFTTATFIGYILGGIPAALTATAGIFLPAFIFVALSGPLVPRIRRSPVAAAFLDGVNVASLALMAVVTAQLSAAALVDGITVFIAAVSAVLLFRYQVGSVWLVAGGAGVGMLKAWVWGR